MEANVAIGITGESVEPLVEIAEVHLREAAEGGVARRASHVQVID